MVDFTSEEIPDGEKIERLSALVQALLIATRDALHFHPHREAVRETLLQRAEEARKANMAPEVVEVLTHLATPTDSEP